MNKIQWTEKRSPMCKPGETVMFAKNVETGKNVAEVVLMDDGGVSITTEKTSAAVGANGIVIIGALPVIKPETAESQTA